MSAIQTIEHDDKPVAVVSQADAVLSMIERVARDPASDIDKLERMLQMQERILQRNAEMAFNSAMRECKLQMPHVLRTSENSHTRSRYATLESISKVVDPIIHQHGFTLSFGTDQSLLPGHYGVCCEASHIDGFTKMFRADIPSDAAGARGASNKNLTQAFGSTMTYGRRYLKCMIFDIQVTNEDDDGHAAGNAGRDEFPGDTPVKSSAQLKREGAWESVEADLMQDLQDCQSIVGLHSLKAHYRARAKKEGWNRTFLEQLAELFLRAEERLSQVEGGEA